MLESIVFGIVVGFLGVASFIGFFGLLKSEGDDKIGNIFTCAIGMTLVYGYFAGSFGDVPWLACGVMMVLWVIPFFLSKIIFPNLIPFATFLFYFYGTITGIQGIMNILPKVDPVTLQAIP